MASKSWTRIDRTESGLLDPLYDDPCFYYLIRTSEGFSNSIYASSNSRIINFKHSPERHRGTAAWPYKLQEIENFADDVEAWLESMSRNLARWQNVALVPMPTSKPSDHEFFDSRLVDLCEQVARLDSRVRVENILDVTEVLPAAHLGGGRDVGFLKSKTILREPSQPLYVVILIDDILTTGSHYVAARELIKGRYPWVNTAGLFLGRHRQVI